MLMVADLRTDAKAMLMVADLGEAGRKRSAADIASEEAERSFTLQEISQVRGRFCTSALLHWLEKHTLPCRVHCTSATLSH